MADIRLSTLSRLATTAGTTILAYISGGRPVGIDPSALWPTPSQIGAATNSDLANGLTTKQNVNERGLANGYASLDSTGRVPLTQIPAGLGGGGGGSAGLSDSDPSALGAAPYAGASSLASRGDHVHPLPAAGDIGAAPVTHTHSITAVSGLQQALNLKMDASLRGAINGVASLAADGKVPSAQLPPGISQASLDLKADAAATTAALALKADLTYVDAGLAGKANATDPRIVNAITADWLATIENFGGNYTAVTADRNKIKRCTATGDVNVTLPALAVGTTIRFYQGNTGRMTFVAGSGQALDVIANTLITIGKGSNVIATVVATNIWNINGNLA